MKFRINYNGKYEDFLIVEENAIEEIREKANLECKSRGWKTEDCWSERLEG